ncbi:centriolin-like [Lampris incognitus]|uniref:centriolin-like n=1 Tax=Lampris incognitus TaxID=2546036 RepID=UPI0024B547B1|nr:centriolin-like [Lampris incognitus]
MMSRKHEELEGRLDNMLSLIAMETQEIKELEQQLTDGQILANEALQRDLEGIISSLQEYLRELREQARRALLRAQTVEAQNQDLLRQLQDTQNYCSQLQNTLRTHRQDMCCLQAKLSVLQKENQALKERQGQVQIQQARQEELEQTKLEQSRTVLLDLWEVQDRLGKMAESLSTGQTRYSPRGPEDVLGHSLEKFYRDVQQHIADQIKAATQQNRQALNQRTHIQDELQTLETQLTTMSVDRSSEAKLQHLRAELHNQGEELQRSRQQVQQVEEESDTLLAKLWSERSCLHRELRQLKSLVAHADQLTVKQLISTAHELSSLHTTLDLMERTRDQRRMEEPDNSFHQTHMHLKRQHTRSLTHTHTQTAVHQHAQAPIPPHLASLGSQGTQDSGLGLQYLSSPERGRGVRGPREEGQPTGGYNHLSVLHTHTGTETETELRDSGGGSDGNATEDDRRRGSFSPSPGPGCVLSPPTESAVLHCNMPEHTDTVTVEVEESEDDGVGSVEPVYS